MLARIKSFFANKTNTLFLFLSAILTANSLFFLASQSAFFSIFHNSLSHNFFYFIYFLTFVLGVGYIILEKTEMVWSYLLEKMLLLYLPTEIIFIYGLQKIETISPYIGPVSALYIFLATIYLILIHQNHPTEDQIDDNQKQDQANVSKGKKWLAPSILLLIIFLHLFVGAKDIEKFSAVDEPLWTFDRIPNFWRDFGKKKWEGSRVSDKPGLTVALISGVGLFFEENPKQFNNMPWRNNVLIPEQEIERFNFVFRFPIYLFASISLIAFYLLIKTLTDKKTALLSAIFIGLSPILIGNTRIINPDGLLWIFSTLALISYFIYLIYNKRKYLYLSGFILGLSILTKYVANILYVFFFGLIFLEYIFDSRKQSMMNLFEYLKKRLPDYALLVIISLATFYVLYPGVWGKPDRVIIGTIGSQAFSGVWPLFAAIITFVLIDMLLFKNFILGKIIGLFAKYKKLLFSILMLIFSAAIIFTFINTYTNMSIIDFEEVLSSPKSSHERIGPLGIFLSNFYPLVFGVYPLVIIFVLMLSIKNVFRNNPNNPTNRTIAYLLAFILFYYLGSTVSQVASIIRYQIMIFPLIFIAGAFSFSIIIKKYEKKFNSPNLFIAACLIFLGLNVFSLISIRPFFEDYASILLPKKYYINLKDMGSGSYEAAQYLNSLPNSEKLRIWSDKQGVCSFFRGSCSGTFSTATLNTANFDYFVISAGRENRTTKINASKIIHGKTFVDIYTDSDNVAYKMELGGRPNNYIRIIDAKKLFN